MINTLLQNIHWLGHDGFRVDGNTVIYFDPYQINQAVPADIILISHEHYDHCSPADIQKIVKPDTVIITNKASAGQLSGDVRIVKPGNSLTVKDITIEAVPSYNTNKEFHPREAEMLGFIVTVEGIRVYHAGDTDFIPEMRQIRADIALLPVSGTYVMTADEAVEAALAIKPVVVIPMHFGCIVGSEQDAKRFADMLSGKVTVNILNVE